MGRIHLTEFSRRKKVAKGMLQNASVSFQAGGVEGRGRAGSQSGLCLPPRASPHLQNRIAGIAGSSQSYLSTEAWSSVELWGGPQPCKVAGTGKAQGCSPRSWGGRKCPFYATRPLGFLWWVS